MKTVHQAIPHIGVGSTRSPRAVAILSNILAHPHSFGLLGSPKMHIQPNDLIFTDQPEFTGQVSGK